MQMQKVNVSELSGAALDWCVATSDTGKGWILDLESFMPNHCLGRMNYSTDWAHGGPIIERERIDLNAKINAGSDFDEWRASIGIGAKQRHRYGDTPLIAAMRCYVTSKLGEVVEVPEELLK